LDILLSFFEKEYDIVFVKRKGGNRMNVALIGTGLMGFPMAEKLLEAGFSTTVFNRTHQKAEPLKPLGAHIAETPSEAINSADVVILMLTDYRAIEGTLFSAAKPVDFSNRTIIQMGTILPEESLNLSKRVSHSGGAYLEAPVLGSIPNVKGKQLLVMVGATEEQFHTYEKIFRAFGSNIYWIGEVGKAAVVKLALNHLIASLTAGFALSLGVVQENDVDVDIFMSVLRHSALYAPTFDKKLSQMLERNFAGANFPLKHLQKDVNFIYTLANTAGLNTVGLEALREIFIRAVEQGLAEADYSALYNAVYPKK
jgi:3-hydroxyisobutyrate dehydrogenase